MLSQGGPLNLGMRFRVCVVFFFPAKLLTDICHFSPRFFRAIYVFGEFTAGGIAAKPGKNPSGPKEV